MYRTQHIDGREGGGLERGKNEKKERKREGEKDNVL